MRRVDSRRSGMARRGNLRRILVRAVGTFLLATLALVLPLRWLPPLTTSFMVITWARKPAEAGPLRYDWVDRAAISRHAMAAVLAGEDQRFFEHPGFDFDQIGKAFDENRRGQRVRGASTISQQVAKNLWLWPGHSWLRKGIEAWLTAWVELLLPKPRILELHLNIAQFGPAVFGVEAASRLYFGRPAARVDRGQAALLAAVLPNPVRFSVARPSAYVRRRQAWIMGQAARLERSGALAAADW
jgi:monofunctional biosynthetic peptidoglycan transglycosylase